MDWIFFFVPYNCVYYCLGLPVLWVFFRQKQDRNTALYILEAMNILLAFCGLVLLALTFYSLFTAITSRVLFHLWIDRLTSPTWWAYWGGFLFTQILPQLFWWKNVRRKIVYSIFLMVSISLLIVSVVCIFRIHLISPNTTMNVMQFVVYPIGYFGLTYGISKWLKMRKASAKLAESQT